MHGDIAGCPGHQYGALVGCYAVSFQCENAKHRGVAGGANGHCFCWREVIRALDQPLAFDPCVLSITPVVALSNAPAVEDDGVSGLEFGIGRTLYGPGKINSGDPI